MNRLLTARGGPRRPQVLPPRDAPAAFLVPWSCRWLLGGLVAVGADADGGVVAFGATPFVFDDRVVPPGVAARGALSGGRVTVRPLPRCGPPLADPASVLLETPATNVWRWSGGQVPSVGRPGDGGAWVCTGCNREFTGLREIAAHWAAAGWPRLHASLRVRRPIEMRPHLPLRGLAAPAGVYTPRSWSGPSTGATAALLQVRDRLAALLGPPPA